jgi:predicted Zn-ribbon and HTH transcriptional regulator
MVTQKIDKKHCAVCGKKGSLWHPLMTFGLMERIALKIKFKDLPSFCSLSCKKAWLNTFQMNGIVTPRLLKSSKDYQVKLKILKKQLTKEQLIFVKGLSEKIFMKIPENPNFNKLELKRICNHCKKTWFVSLKELNEIVSKLKNTKTGQIGMLMVSPLIAAASSSKLTESTLEKQLNDLNKCPECKSSNFKETLEIIE